MTCFTRTRNPAQHRTPPIFPHSPTTAIDRVPAARYTPHPLSEFYRGLSARDPLFYQTGCHDGAHASVPAAAGRLSEPPGRTASGATSAPSARWLVLLLLLLCLAPRVVMALRIPSICIDGAVYVRHGPSLGGRRLPRAVLSRGGINIYPVILMLLHRLGLDWEVAGAVWGVTISSLVVLPLWGWVRRQFDDRVALVACLLYAVHPKFIIESPEVMRDPTFWFFFMLAIYWLWRAVTEVRYGYFIAAGAVITLALLTRVEGVFLLIPLVLWTFWRWLALREGRGSCWRARCWACWSFRCCWRWSIWPGCGGIRIGR